MAQQQQGQQSQTDAQKPTQQTASQPDRDPRQDKPVITDFASI